MSRVFVGEKEKSLPRLDSRDASCFETSSPLSERPSFGKQHHQLQTIWSLVTINAAVNVSSLNGDLRWPWRCPRCGAPACSSPTHQPVSSSSRSRRKRTSFEKVRPEGSSACVDFWKTFDFFPYFTSFSWESSKHLLSEKSSLPEGSSRFLLSQKSPTDDRIELVSQEKIRNAHLNNQ